MTLLFRMRKATPAGFTRAALIALCLANGAAYTLSQSPPEPRPPEQPLFDATRLSKPTSLDGSWLLHAGDDPAYADPRFDDAQWTLFDIGESLHTIFPAGNPGVIWYRLRIKVAPDETGLAVRESSISHAFVVYANGAELLRAGRFAPYVPYNTNAPLIEPISADQIGTGSIVLALRVHIDANEWKDSNPGLHPGNLRLGRQDEMRERQWSWVVRHFGENCVELLLNALLCVAGFVLYSAGRSRREYLWLTLYSLSYCLVLVFVIYGSSHVFPLAFQRLRIIPQFGISFFPLLMYCAFVRQRIRPLFLALFALASLCGAIEGQPHVGPALFFYLTTPANVLFILAIPTVLFVHWRRGNREAGVLAIPAFFVSVSFVALFPVFFGLAMGHPFRISWVLRPAINVGAFDFTFSDCADLLSSMSLGLIILLRSNRMSREAAIHEGQLAAAREMQRILLPERIEVIPGFTVDTAYLPAQQVGGDFFQVIPIDKQGMLMLVGDVAGKGLPAAMMVSVLVGAIRTLAAFTHHPAEVLAQLNQQLIGRTGSGFSTAIVTYIAADGSTSIANAGHLNPYLDGQELDLPGALPLGVLADAAYEEIGFTLGCGNRLMFYSDGVIEAQNAGGELLGFERGRELSNQTAATIVEAARAFGQTDDITAVAISRTYGS